MHDEDEDDPPDEELDEIEVPRAEDLPIPIVGEKPQEDAPPIEKVVPDIVPSVEEIVPETIPDDIAASVPDPTGGEVEVPVPQMPQPGPGTDPIPGPAPGRSGRPQPAGVGAGGGAHLGAPSGGRASALAGAQRVGGPRAQMAGNAPPAAAVAINRAFRGMVSRQIVPSRGARRAALVRPPGAAQRGARPPSNLRGVEAAGRRGDVVRGLINRARAGVAEEATARAFAQRRPLMAVMAGGAAAQVAVQNRPGRRPGGTQTPRGRTGAGAGFFFNQSAQLRRLLSQR